MADRDEIMAAFDSMRKYFNAHDFTTPSWTATMTPILDANVAMKKLDDIGYHIGNDVERYFTDGHGKDDEAQVEYRAPHDCWISADLGIVSGFADFTGKNGASHKPPSRSRIIAYSFAFKKVGGIWKAIHLWGRYIP